MRIEIFISRIRENKSHSLIETELRKLRGSTFSRVYYIKIIFKNGPTSYFTDGKIVSFLFLQSIVNCGTVKEKETYDERNKTR